MNGGTIQKVTGNVAQVNFDGKGPGSGTLEIHLEPVHMSFEVFMDTPRKKYFEIFAAACSSMWDSKMVEITYSVKSGDNIVADIRQL
jgi:hypothetical protein